ncbi:MAG: DUF1893 domain-containing protein [Clostridia bacterium]|nr:DUF1893 domain-containing protein [Clostridia bacterium]
MTDLEKARALLAQEGCTCVLCLDGRTVTSHRRGVAPLLALLESGENYSGFSAADKVIGKATALLYRLLGVKAVWAAVISESAIRALEAGGIEAHWERSVPHIINRAGTGPCPMEAATAAIDDPQEALEAVRTALKNLQS